MVYDDDTIRVPKDLWEASDKICDELLYPDIVSEFINYHMKVYCDALSISMTRSRPNHNNDNMCVEERNGHIVRKKIGYIRIDCEETVVALNQYYDKLCLLYNHFIPVRRTK